MNHAVYNNMVVSNCNYSHYSYNDNDNDDNDNSNYTNSIHYSN